MVDKSGLQLPPPTDWQSFERVMRRLFAAIFDWPHTYNVGRHGQGQGGIDIVSRRRDRGHVGIQCKLKDELAADPHLRRAAFRKEVEAARTNFKPRLSEFILATTAADDADLQAYARELTELYEAEGLEVYVYGWTQLRSLIGEYPSVRELYLGNEGVPELKQQIGEQHKEVRESFALLRLDIKTALNPAPGEHLDDERFTRRLERIKAKLASKHVREAISDLEALREDDWEAASDRQRFRILTSLGAAHWQLGESQIATGYFVEASALQPDDEKGLANLAAVRAVGGDPHGAREAALRLLEINPQTEAGLLALMQAEEAIAPHEDPLNALPEDRRGCEEALIGAVQILRVRDDRRWTRLARDAATQFPGSDELARFRSEAVLYRLATVDGGHVGARISDPISPTEVEEAVAILARQWQEHLALDPVQLDASLAQNLAQLLRALDREKEAIAVLERLGPEADEEGRTVHLHSLLLMMDDRKADAIAALETRLDIPANRLLLCQLLEDQPAEMRRRLAEGDWSAATPDELMWRAVLEAEARAATEEDYDPTADFEAAQAEHPQRLVPSLAIAKRLTSRDQMIAAANALLERANGPIPFSDVLQAALWLRQSDLPALLITLLRDRIALDRDSKGLRWLIEALHQVDDRQGFTAVFDLLPAEVQALPRYLHYQLVGFFKIGDMARARAAAEAVIQQQPHDLKLRLHWAQILLRQGDQESIAAWLRTLDETQVEGEPEDLGDLGLLLANHGHADRARDFGYRVARRFPASKIAQERFVGIMFNDPAPRDVLLDVKSVGPDTVFELIDEEARGREYRLETEDDLPRESIDLETGARIACAAAGLKEGDSLVLPPTLPSGRPQRFTVGKVRHKHLHLFQTLLETLPERFAGAPMFHRFKVDPSAPDAMAELHEQLRQQAEQIDRSLSDYLNQRLPLRTFAAANGFDIIDAYDGMREKEEARFLCSEGTGELRHHAGHVAQNHERGCVVDALTLELVRRLELVELVERLLGGLAVTQATIDLFHHRVDKLAAFGGRQHATIGHQNGQIVGTRTYPAQLETVTRVRVEARDWAIAQTTIVPSIGAPGLARRIHDAAPEGLVPHFFDDILAASQGSFVLLSDDLGYRRLSNVAGVMRTISLASLLRLAARVGVVSRRFLVEKLAMLGRARHSGISLDASDYMEGLDIDQGSFGSCLSGIVALLDGRNWALEPQMGPLCEFLDRVWRDEERREIRLQLIQSAGQRLLAGEPERRAAFFRNLLSNPDRGVEALRRQVGALTRERERRAA